MSEVYHPPKTDDVKEWMPVTPRQDGSMRRWREGKDSPAMLVGWLGIGPEVQIGTALNDAKPGEPFSFKPYRFIQLKSSLLWDEELLKLCEEDE